MGLSKTAFNYCVSLTQDSQHENMRAKKQKKEARVSQIHRKNLKFRSTNTLKKHLKPHFPWLTIRLCCTRNRKKKDFLMKRVIWNWTTKYWRHEGANIWRTSKRLVQFWILIILKGSNLNLGVESFSFLNNLNFPPNL